MRSGRRTSPRHRGDGVVIDDDPFPRFASRRQTAVYHHFRLVHCPKPPQQLDVRTLREYRGIHVAHSERAQRELHRPDGRVIVRSATLACQQCLNRSEPSVRVSIEHFCEDVGSRPFGRDFHPVVPLRQVRQPQPYLLVVFQDDLAEHAAVWHGVFLCLNLPLFRVARSPIEDQAEHPHAPLRTPFLAHTEQAAARTCTPAAHGGKHARYVERLECTRQLLR